MRDYGQVQCALWASPRFKGLSVDARLLFVYLLSGPHSNGLGCYSLPAGYVSADMKWTPERVSKGFAELSENRFANYCESTEFVFIPGYLKWNPIANANISKAREKEYTVIPGSFVYIQQLAREMIQFGNHWAKGFETVLQTVYQTREEPKGTEQEQEYEKIHTQSGNPDVLVSDGKPKTITAKCLADMGVAQQVATDYLAVRKAKRLPLTETALRALQNQFTKAGMTLAQGIELCAKEGWAGYKAGWKVSTAGDQKQGALHAFDSVDYTKGVDEHGNF